MRRMTPQNKQNKYSEEKNKKKKMKLEISAGILSNSIHVDPPVFLRFKSTAFSRIDLFGSGSKTQHDLKNGIKTSCERHYGYLISVCIAKNTLKRVVCYFSAATSRSYMPSFSKGLNCAKKLWIF
jgi:hypothetical protein